LAEESERDTASSFDELAEAIRSIKVEDLLLSSVSTLASIAYDRLGANDLDEARLAIDAIAALLPVLGGEVDDGIHKSFASALAKLRLDYASAVNSAK